jgi:hypothetical protein
MWDLDGAFTYLTNIRVAKDAPNPPMKYGPSYSYSDLVSFIPHQELSVSDSKD